MLPQPLQNLTAIVPFRNGQATIEKLIDSLPDNLPVIVVDDMSDLHINSTRKNIKIERLAERSYFAGAVNKGIELCETDVLILNQDVWLEGTEWQTLLGRRETYGIGGDAVFGHPAWPKGYTQGTFMWLTRQAIIALDGQPFDAKLYPLWGCTAYAQLQLCRKGFKALPLDMRAHGMHHARANAPYGSAIKDTLRQEPDKTSLYLRTPPAVSVIVTCYNYGRFLQDAITSLLNQTFQSFEIIIVDDGSTDNTAEIAQALADAWRGIHFIRLEKNMGSAAAMNAGIEQAHGKYLAPLDADDMMASNRLQVLYDAAQHNPHKVIYDDCMEIAEAPDILEQARPNNSGPILPYAGYFATHLPLREYDFDKLLTQNGMHKGIFFERAAIKEIGGYAEEFRDGREDWAINIALGAKGYCGVHVKEALYLRRQHGANRHLTNTTREYRDKFLNQLHKRFPDLYAGERPAMCCGNKGGAHTSNNGAAQTMKASSNGRNTMSDTLGHTGMTLLEYLPVTSGTRTFTGALTRHTYVFGGKRKQGYVDTRDASNFLTLRDNTLPLFREIVVSPVKLQHTEPPPPVTPEPNQTAITQAAAPPDTTHPAKKMTVKKSL